MEIKVNNTRIQVSNFDNEETILVKYILEVEKNALPEYFYIQTENFRLEDGNHLNVEDIRKELKILDPKEFFEKLETLQDKYHMPKLNITLLFLDTYDPITLEDILKGNRKIMEQLREVDVGRFTTVGAVTDSIAKYKKTVKKERETLKENLKFQMRIDATLEGLERESPMDTHPFKPEDISIEIPIQLSSDNSLSGIFDIIETSKKVPYVILLHRGRLWVKTYRHIYPARDWFIKTRNINLDGPDEIIFWVLNSQTPQLPSRDITKFYSVGSWSLQNKIEITIDAKKTQKEIIKDNLLSSLGGRIQYRLLPEKTVKIKGTFVVSNVIFNRMVFSDMIMNNKTVAYFFFMNETDQSVSEKQRYWLYYSPKQTGDVENALTISITPESDESEYWIKVRIGRAKSLQEINSFIRVFSSILGLYIKNNDNVMREYGEIIGNIKAQDLFFESIKGQTEKKIDKKTGKRLKALKLAAPSMIQTNYTCQKGRQPYFISSKEESREIKKNLGNLGKYKVMEYPYKSGQYFACEPRYPKEEDKRYPGLIINQDDTTKAEYPLVPCCFANNNYVNDNRNAKPSKLMLYRSSAKELEDSGMTNMTKIHLEAANTALEKKKMGTKEHLRPLDSKKILDKGRYGIIPYYIQEIAKKAGYKEIKYHDKNTIPLLAYGVLHTPDSFIHCLERAFDKKYETLELKDKMVRVKRIREKWADMDFSIAKQELYDCSHEAIANLLKEKDHYIDPSMFISLASKYYDCNIFLYEINSRYPHGSVVIPRFSQAYLLKDISEVQKTVFIIKRAIKNYPYPYQCEIIVQIEDSEFNREFNPIFKHSQFIVEAVKVLNNANTVYIVTQEGSFYYSPVNTNSLIFKGAISQVIDKNGKTRRLTYNSGVTLMTSPLPPLSLPITKEYEISHVPRIVAENFIKEKNLVVTYQDGDEESGRIQGLWVKSNIQNSGLYYGYIPLDKSESYPSISFSSPITEDPSGGTEISELKIMKKNRKTAELIQAYTLYEYSKLDDKEDINSLFFVDENHQYDIHTLGEVIESDNNVIYSGGKIVIPSEDVRDRLIFYINNKLLNDPETVENYKDSKIIKNYYTRIDDFRKRPEEIIFSSLSPGSIYTGPTIYESLETWSSSTKRNIKNRTISPEWVNVGDKPYSPEWNQLKKDPYFFRNNNIKSGKMAIIQNVEKGLLNLALYVAVKWVEGNKEDRINFGYSPLVIEEDIKDHAYVIYHENGDKPKKVAGGGEKAFVIEYNDNNYGAVLFL